MNKRIFTLIALAILWSPVFVSAQDTYGFSWGVSVGDAIPYAIEITTNRTDNVIDTYAEDVIVTVEYLEDLSEYQSHESFPPAAQTNITYANGTEIGFTDPVIGSIFSILIFPIGNWTHYKYLTENVIIPDNTSFVTEFFEDLSAWSLHFDLSSGVSNVQNATYQFSKVDGALNSFTSYSYVEFGIRNDFVVSQTTTTKISRTATVWFFPTFTISAIAIIAEVIIVIEIFRRYRGRNAVVAG